MTAQITCAFCGIPTPPPAMMVANGWRRRPSQPGAWTCGLDCERRARSLESSGHGNVDAASAVGRAIVDAAMPPPRAEPKDAIISCSGCTAAFYVAEGTDGETLARLAKAQGYGQSPDGRWWCSGRCQMFAPKPAPAAGSGVLRIEDVTYQRALAMSREARGLPRVAEHERFFQGPTKAAAKGAR